MTLLLEHRAALVTGGAGRIGRVIAAVLRREGARVAIADLDPGRVEAARADGHAEAALVMDVSDPGDVERTVTAAEEAVGPVDMLVNAHGRVTNRPVLDMDPADWDRTFAVNVRGTALCCQALARRWVARGTNGAIVNLSSGAAVSGRPGSAHYSGSKAAVNMLTQVLAIELGPHRIRVNAVMPGLVMDHAMTEPDPAGHPYLNMMLDMTPLGRTGLAIDIAEAVAFLLSDRSAWTTGSLLHVSGGSHCGRTNAPLSGNLRMHPQS